MKRFCFIITLFACLYCSCEKRCQIFGGYTFVLPATLAPALETYKIGDTITISSLFDDQVYEQKTDKSYLLQDFLFYPETAIYKIDSTDNQNGLSNFEIIIDTSRYTYNIFYFNGGATALFGEYTYENNLYDLEYKIIPKISGLYYLEQGSSLYPSNELQEFPGRCKNVSSEAKVDMNTGASNNIDLLKDSPVEHYNTWILEKPDDRFHKFGGYAFWVVE